MQMHKIVYDHNTIRRNWYKYQLKNIIVIITYNCKSLSSGDKLTIRFNGALSYERINPTDTRVRYRTRHLQSS